MQVALYAELALSVVLLDLHDLVYPFGETKVTFHDEGNTSQYLISVETAGYQIEAVFEPTKPDSGMLRLGRVTTPHWMQRFDSVDRFDGYDHFGLPRYIHSEAR